MRPQTIPNPKSLARANRRLTRRNDNVQQVLAAMKAGATLQCYFQNGRELWCLSSGPFVPRETAINTISHPHVIGVGDTLFLGTRSQTYRVISD